MMKWMRGLRGRSFLGGTLALLIIGALMATLMAAGGRPGRPRHATGLLESQRLGRLVQAPPTARSPLASEIDRAQATIDDASSTRGELARAGLAEQLATGALLREGPQMRRATLALLGGRAAAGMRADVDAAKALSSIVPAQAKLPRWRIVRPPRPATLLGYFRGAQARFGIPWQYLAAIELVETRFGRIRGASAAGAKGPMQFMPSTWSRYGRGRIDDQRDAIFAAARYLAASGAPANMADALYHYNHSRSYVRAVEDYASWMRSDTRAFYGYYYWQVLFARVGATVILPVGYPKARPVRVAPQSSP